MFEIAAFILFRLAPTDDAFERAYRLDVAKAISSVTDDAHEQRLLASIAFHESGFRPEVGSCRVKGDAGRALGLWQVHARSAYERASICSSLRASAYWAHRRVRESIVRCNYLPARYELAAYVSGRCDRGHAAALRRWVP